MPSIPLGPAPGESTRSPILDLLELEVLDTGRYRARPWAGPGAGRHLFGGQVIAQALRAAVRSVDARYAVQSLHSYFVQAGDGTAPIDITVEPIRDGRSFVTRRVVAAQQDRIVLVLDCSFQAAEPGGEYQVAMTADLPGPDDDHPWGPLAAPAYFPELFEQRDFLPDGPDEQGVFRSTRRFWIRARHPLPDDPGLHAVVLAFVSDCATLLGAEVSIGAYGHRGMRTSLDHCLWFHRPARLDDWVLIDYRPMSNSSARGLVIGGIHTRSGSLVATAAQEVLTRP